MKKKGALKCVLTVKLCLLFFSILNKEKNHIIFLVLSGSLYGFVFRIALLVKINQVIV